MQITFTPHSYNNKIISQKPQPSFEGLLSCDPKTGCPIDSWFFRDYETLSTAAKEIKTAFPNGTRILDFACSNGEEMISLKALLPEKHYNIIGYDTSEHALKLAKKGVYTVFSNWYDSFLLPDCAPKGEEAYLQKAFHFIMKQDTPPVQDRFINNKVSFLNVKNYIPNFKELFFKVRDNYVESIDIRRGDIRNLGNNRTLNTGAIFFRNAFYQICGNDLSERLKGKGDFEILNVDKLKAASELADRVYNKLEKGGIFVIGDHIKDHLFVADRFAPNEDVIRFRDTVFYNPELVKHRANADMKVYKKSPLAAALEKDGRFSPIGFSTTFLEHGDIKLKVPTIWKRLK